MRLLLFSVALCLVSSVADAACTKIFLKFQYLTGDNTWGLTSKGGGNYEDPTSTVTLATVEGVTTVTFRAPGAGMMVWTTTNMPCDVGGGFVLKSNSSTATVPTISVTQSQ